MKHNSGISITLHLLASSALNLKIIYLAFPPLSNTQGSWDLIVIVIDGSRKAIVGLVSKSSGWKLR